MNTKQKGDIIELKIILALTKLGFTVLIPYGDHNRYDCVVETNGKFFRIQCKAAHTKDNHRKKGKNICQLYTKNEIDYFATAFNDQCYLIPVEECNTNKRLRLHQTKNKQNKDITWAKDYELETIAKKW